MIPSQNYFRADALQTELVRLFAPAFEFVALTTELENHNDFVCVDYEGCAIVVQNFKGSLRAFQNVCSHRFNKIQFEDRGNRPLMCRYHGWSYDEAGMPRGMPRRSEYAIETPETVCLTRYRIEICGKFVFVNRNENNLTLRDYLGSFYEVLETVSANLGEQIYQSSVPHKANWKVLVENVIDNYHCALLHRDSFVSFGFCRSPVEDVVIDGSHSSWHVPRTEGDREAVRRRALSHLQARGFVHDSFYHIYIFPNLFVASTEGISFYVGHALPVSAEETVLRVRYFEPAVELAPGQRVRQEMLNEQTRTYGLDVIEEDRSILENVQKGLRLTDKPGVIPEGEPRIRAFMARYSTLMSADPKEAVEPVAA